MTGDGELVAKIESFDHVQAFSQAGVMLRESLEDGSRFVAQLLMSTPGPILRERLETGGTVNQKP